jgi:hypothetical protein
MESRRVLLCRRDLAIWPIAALALIAAHGCLFAVGANDAPQIYGGSEEYYSEGRLSILQQANPNARIVVAVKFPKAIDQSWTPDFGHSGNGDDSTHWEDIYKVRFENREDAKALEIAWEYSTRSRKLRFAGKEFDSPVGKIAVLGYDKGMKPTCELREDSSEVIKKLRNELGAGEETAPASPSIPSGKDKH